MCQSATVGARTWRARHRTWGMSHFCICVNSKKGANMDYLFHIVPAVAVGLQITLKIFIITIVLSLPLGILMAIGRISNPA